MAKEDNVQVSPNGSLLLRTMAMPADTNPAGDIFGGWIMSRLDIAGAILAREIAKSNIVTVAVDAMTFVKPVHVGDTVCCYGYCSYLGTTSLKINLEIWVKRCYDAEIAQRELVTKGCFTYVCMDEKTKAPKKLPESAYEIARAGTEYNSTCVVKDIQVKK